MELKTCIYCKKVVYNENLFEPNKLDFHWKCVKEAWYKQHIQDWRDVIKQFWDEEFRDLNNGNV